MIPIFRYVFWYHEERMVNYDLSSTSSVSVKTTEESGITRSVLTIANADPKDAGNYTCKPSNAIAASIQVFVSEGKKKKKLFESFGLWIQCSKYENTIGKEK